MFRIDGSDVRGECDIFFFGHVAIDIIKTPGEEYKITAGPILFAVWAAHQLGQSVGVLTKTSLKDRYRLEEFPIPKGGIFWRESEKTALNLMDYTSETMERRVITALQSADCYSIEDFPEFSAKLLYYCSLYTGEIDVETIRLLSQKAPIAIDVQGFLRKVFPGGVVQYSDWEEKMEILPLSRFFKADAAEAAFITGFDTEFHGSRIRAAEQFLTWGAKEVLISHHTELIAGNKNGLVSAPLRNRSSSGRTGRGDTCFASYITERFKKEPAEAIEYSAAVTSLKLEERGPFKKSRKDVEIFLKDFY